MPVLNRVKGVYRGRALVQFVRVAGRVIWQARKIVGWNKIAGPFTASSVSNSQSKIEFDALSKDEFKPIATMEDIWLRINGKYYEVSSMAPRSSGNKIYLKGETKNVISRGDSFEIFQAKYG
ncbi:hypothetical protein [Corynebacterium amycolatum]|uniref:hypothetical protein n=1 Tax=Corynebacterium amycolatum TaxID=43765 RepID=UPI00211A217B|nr:hypothetical protein [Corynebacterium amycolatum]MCQ9167501.1 hypothetical protein [Corynebacterium amycolatum]MCQ9173750.1 hypothetical protein [Corynebacterium amycolatum]